MKAPLYDPGAISSAARRRFSGEVEQMLQDVKIYADIGVSHIIFDARGSDLSKTLERMAWLAEEVISQA